MAEEVVEKMTMQLLVGDLGKIVEGAMGWAKTVATTVAGNPLLLFGVVVGFVGLGVGLFKRLMNV